MDEDIAMLKRLYERFNARDINGVLEELAEDVAWANGMEGGHVQGHAAVRDYWTRQWAVVSPRVEPVSFHRASDGALVARVRQTLFGLDGAPLEGQAQGLATRTVGHSFHLRGGKVTRFDIEETPGA